MIVYVHYGDRKCNDTQKWYRMIQKIAIHGLWLSTTLICTSNHMFKKEIWNKFQKMSEVNFHQISRINMWFPVNHMWQALKEHTRVRITQKTINQYQQI